MYYEIRQNPKLYSIFAQLLRNPKLTVSLDRVCMKPPHSVIDEEGWPKTFETFAFPIHNDMNLWDLRETKYQGGLALEDAPMGGGGFRCIPGYHRLEKSSLKPNG
jgi:hypothetical protein